MTDSPTPSEPLIGEDVAQMLAESTTIQYARWLPWIREIEACGYRIVRAEAAEPAARLQSPDPLAAHPASAPDAQASDLLAALAERNIYSRGDLEAASPAPAPDLKDAGDCGGVYHYALCQSCGAYFGATPAGPAVPRHDTHTPCCSIPSEHAWADPIRCLRDMETWPCTAMIEEGPAVDVPAALDVEQLAEVEHEQWIEWASTLLAMEPGISEARRERWQRLIATPYADLTEAEKHQDRIYAEKVLARLQSPDPTGEPE